MTHKPESSSPRLALVLIFVWVAAMTFSFMSFDLTKFRNIGDTGENQVATHMFDPALLDQLIAANPNLKLSNTVIHFWHPNCDCSSLIAGHIRRLIQLANTRHMKSQIIAFQPTAMTEDEVRKEVQIQFGRKINVGIVNQENAEILNLTASPSAAVINSFGTLLYFGPYSSDAYCSTEKESFVESAVIQAKNNIIGERAGILLASGCLCSWNEESTSRRSLQQLQPRQ